MQARHGDLRAEGRRGRAGAAARAVLRAAATARYVFRPRPPARRHLRSPRPRAGSADLARRPAVAATRSCTSTPSQARILGELPLRAQPTAGFLFLGKSEMLLTRTNLFAPVDLKRRVFAKIRRRTARPPRLLPRGRRGGRDRRPTGADARCSDRRSRRSPLAQLVVDADGHARAREPAGAACSSASTQRDLGRPLQDLELSYRPVELRSRLDEVRASARAGHRSGTSSSARRHGEPRSLRRRARPARSAATAASVGDRRRRFTDSRSSAA